LKLQAKTAKVSRKTNRSLEIRIYDTRQYFSDLTKNVSKMESLSHEKSTWATRQH